MKRIVAIISLFICTVSALAIGEWTVFPTSDVFRRGEFFADRIFLLSGNSLVSVKEEEYSNMQEYNRLTGLNGTQIFDIAVSPSANRLVVVYHDGNIDFIDENDNVSNLPDYANKVIMGDRTITGISERDGRLYISTGFGFLIVNIAKEEFEDTLYYDISEYGDGTFGERKSTISPERLAELNGLLKVNGTASASNAVIALNDGILITSNVESDFRCSTYNEWGVISILDTYEDEWETITAHQINPLTDGTTWFQGTTSISIDPRDNRHFFVGTFALGLFEFRNNVFHKCYNGFNSPDVESIIPNSYTTRIGGIQTDEQGYTWFVNVGVNNPLRCLTPSGDILKFPVKGYKKIDNGFDRLLLAKNDPYRFKWLLGIRPWQSSQAAIFYDGGTPEDVSDDESISFSSLTDQDGNVITPNYFNDIAEDKNGAVWLLTTSGPFVIDSQIEAYRHPGKVRRIKIPRNDGTNLADYLLAGVDCFCIAVDAANRKWIGTKDAGLYLLSADGLTQLEHFTSENSPLPSDNILALAYDDVSGTLFISCEGGIVSYVSDAIRGADNFSNVVCYPNPIRPEYSGPLHITKLKDNTKIKICDISNNVVYSTVSEGGAISWDLVNESGSRVKSGVYIVYGYDPDGKGGVVTKFLVI